MIQPLKILFVCSRNRWRSLTAEKLFEHAEGCKARSAGTEPAARIRINAGHVLWADLICVMEKKHLRRLQAKFPVELEGKTTACLHVPDAYGFMDPELVELLECRVPPLIKAARP